MRMPSILATVAVAALLLGLGVDRWFVWTVQGRLPGPNEVRGPAPALGGTAQRVFIPVDPAKTEDLVPYTEPHVGVYSLGRQIGEHVILDFPRKCPGFTATVYDIVLSIPESEIGLLPVPYGLVRGSQPCPVDNPKNWTVVDMAGRLRSVSFPYLTFVGDTSVVDQNWKLGSDSLLSTGRVAGVSGETDGIVFGLAYVPAMPPVVRRPLDAAGSPTKCAHGLDPLPTPRGIPPSPAQDKQVRAIIEADVAHDQYHGQYFTLCWHGINAVLRKGEPPVKLWLVNVGLPNAGESPDVETALKNYFFAEENGTLRLLLIEGDNGLSSDKDYRGDFLAAVDLDGDGIDEVLVSAWYYERYDVRIYKQVGGLLHLKGTGLAWGLGG